MMFFDAHCDTALKVLDGRADFFREDGGGHVSLPAMLKAGVKGQIFAVYVLSRDFPGKERQRAEAMIATIQDLVARSKGAMQIATTAGDLERAFSQAGPIAALIGLEGADPLAGSADNLRHFFELGVRDLIPAWMDNPFSGTAFGTDTPLTREGIKLVQLAEELGVMVDVSHLSDAAFWHTLEVTKRPLIASHSNCRAICPSPRNLTDEMIKALADRGGVMGLNLLPAFFSPDYYRKAQPLIDRLRAEDTPEEEKETIKKRLAELELPELKWAAVHIKHAIEVGGEDVIGLGGDLDGTTYLPRGFSTIADYSKFPELLDAAGLSSRQIEKVCYANFLRVFREVLPAA